MVGDQPISWLMFFTLAAGIVIGALAFIYFLRSQRNRDIASHALVEGGNPHQAAPQGALPELFGLATVAVLAMAMLTAGYASKSNYEKNQPLPPVGQKK